MGRVDPRHRPLRRDARAANANAFCEWVGCRAPAAHLQRPTADATLDEVGACGAPGAAVVAEDPAGQVEQVPDPFAEDARWSPTPRQCRPGGGGGMFLLKYRVQSSDSEPMAPSIRFPFPFT